jgi:hypothetical protein
MIIRPYLKNYEDDYDAQESISGVVCGSSRGGGVNGGPGPGQFHYR